MTRHGFTRRIATLGVAAALAIAPVAASAPAQAVRPRSADLTALKAGGHAAIARRLTLLSVLSTRVSNAKHITSADRSTLLGQLSSATSGLKSLDAKISSDSTLAMLRPDLRAIVDQFRIYLLVKPKVHLVLAADRIVEVAGRFDDVAGKIQKAIDKAKASGKDTSAAESALADLKAKVAAAVSAAKGVPDGVTPLTAPGYPGNRPTLLAARASLHTARDDLRIGRGDAATAIASLQ